MSFDRAAGNEIRADFLVIGAGLAGLSFALRVAEHGDVVVLSKGGPAESNTAWAQGGIAAVWDPADSIDAHVEDTLEAGAYLARRADVEAILSEGPAAVRRLIDLGVRFSKHDPEDDDHGAGPGGYSLTREGGHHARRILHHGDATGREIQRAVVEAARAHPRVHLIPHQVAIDLITERKCLRHVAKQRLGLRGPEVEQIYGPGGPEAWMPGRLDRCLGAYVLDVPSGRVRVFTAPVTLLATGGAGKLYRFTSNPDLATGDGVAMAYRAGAMVANMEFVQFHPTCLYHHSQGAKSFLVSEAVRGEGGILRLPDGTAFMDDVHPMGSLAPRDITARAIDAQIKRHGLEYVHLDCTHLDESFLVRRFPAIHARLADLGLDMAREPIPVVPAAHYFCGGVRVDGDGRTRIEGLFAAGEVACTGLHGANRLASNSLLEAAVVGERAARKAVELRRSAEGARTAAVPPWDSGAARDADELVVIAHTWDEIRRLMWNYVGIVRTDRRLERALRRVELIRNEIRTYYWDFKVTRDLIEARNLALLADLVIRSALGRRESRGLHFNLDHAETDDAVWRRDTLLRREW